MAKTKKTLPPDRPAAPRRRISQGTGFVLGILAGLAIVAAIWFAYQSGRESAATPVAASSPSTPPAAQPSATPPPPAPVEFTDAEVAAAPRIGATEAKQLVDAGQAAIVDVRDPQSFAAGHVPGALQIPLAYVQGEIPWFPRDKKLIFYCTWPAEETSARAALIVQRGGLTNAAALQGGLDAWRAAGYPTEMGLPQRTQ